MKKLLLVAAAILPLFGCASHKVSEYEVGCKDGLDSLSPRVLVVGAEEHCKALYMDYKRNDQEKK